MRWMPSADVSPGGRSPLGLHAQSRGNVSLRQNGYTLNSGDAQFEEAAAGVQEQDMRVAVARNKHYDLDAAHQPLRREQLPAGNY